MRSCLLFALGFLNSALAGKSVIRPPKASSPVAYKPLRFHSRQRFGRNSSRSDFPGQYGAADMRLPPAMKAVLSKLARQRTTDATTLARIWLAERLERELKAG
jgi:hypothetical protein